MYIVIVREKNAEALLRQWAKQANVFALFESNRMKLFEQRSLSMFQIGWPHSWENVLIWDAWRKCHIQV